MPISKVMPRSGTSHVMFGTMKGRVECFHQQKMLRNARRLGKMHWVRARRSCSAQHNRKLKLKHVVKSKPSA